MPAITISSVNTGTEELTATAHGLLTGDRFRLRNVGGALPAATPTLVGATDYFCVRTGADTFKISDTNAHALAGTNIVDLTGAGTGTHIVEYGLPYSNPTVLAAAGGQIKSANDLAAWNALVAMYDLLTGQAQSIWTGVQLAGPFGLSALITPAAASGTFQDFAPTGFATASVLRINSSVGAVIIGGIAGGTAGRTLPVYNLGTNTVTLNDQDVGSVLANRIICPAATNFVIRAGGGVVIWYDPTSSKWRVTAP